MALSKSKPCDALPADVKAALQAAVDRLGSQVKVALELDITSPVVSLLLKDNYRGNVAAMGERIRGQYMAETVNCPVMGELGRHSCLEYQTRPLVHTNPQRARLHAACQTCLNRRPAK